MRAGWGVACVLGAVLWSGAARAEPTAQDRALAETLFREGKSLVTAGKVAEACPKFVESQRLDPKVGTLLHVATCHQQEGKNASAWIEFTEAASAAARAHQPDREQLAREQAKALEQKLDRLVVVVKAGAEGLEVKLDDHPLGAAVLGTAMPIDPGSHTLAATAPKKKGWSTTVTFDPGPATQTVEIPPLEDEAPAAAPPAAPVAAPPPAPPPEPREASGGSGARTAGFVLLGVGAVGLGVGAIFGIKAAAQESDAKKICPDKVCPTQDGVDAHKTAGNTALVSTIGFGVGLVAAAAGAYFVLTAPSKEKKSARALWVAPQVGARSAGVGVGGGF